MDRLTPKLDKPVDEPRPIAAHALRPAKGQRAGGTGTGEDGHLKGRGPGGQDEADLRIRTTAGGRE